MRRVSGMALAALLTFAVLGTADAAAPKHGARDPKFSGDGRALVDFGKGPSREIARDVLITSSGKVVLVAQLEVSHLRTKWGVARLKANGKPDNGFSGNGRSVMSIGVHAVPRVVVPAGGGALLVGGRSDDSSALVAYRKDGARKKSFGEGGVAVHDLSPEAEAITDLRVQQDGTVLAAGTTPTGGFVARLLANGELDPGFGDGGVVHTDPSFDGLATTTRAELDPEGRVLVIGEGQRIKTDFIDVDPWAVARFDQTGAPDATFGGGDGLVEEQFTQFDDLCCDVNTARDVAVQPDGALVVTGSGYSFEFDLEYVLLARYTPAGELDESFGDAGRRIIGRGFYTTGEVVTVGSAGKITVAGTSSWGPDPLMVLRFLPNGQNDPKFGRDGMREVYYPNQRGVAAYAMAIRDGRIVVAGESPTGGDGPQAPMVPVARLFS